WLVYLIILGAYLSLRGYHSFDSDQAYRLPLLLHRQDPTMFAADPFVRAFDVFNPHRGTLWVLDLVTRPLGLSAGLLLVFVLTFFATCRGVDRLTQAVWPEAGGQVGVFAIGLVLAAKAGNIGTNHLFEAMVLDRLMAFALGWLALAQVIVEPSRRRLGASAAVAAATVIHPSVGLQLALVLAASWTVWWLLGRWMKVDRFDAFLGIAGLGIAVLPGVALNLAGGSSPQGNMPADAFWLLSVELQSPQHMLPHLWRMPQWLAAGCYVVLAALALFGQYRWSQADPAEPSNEMIGRTPWTPARLRLIVMLAVILAGLGTAWYAVEVLHDVRITIFQPFRMATIARGIALVFVAGRLAALWRLGGWPARLRAILLAVAFTGDWLLVVVTLVELSVAASGAVRALCPWWRDYRKIDLLAMSAMLALGLNFLVHHDTEYGHIPLLAALGLGLLTGLWGRLRINARTHGENWVWTPARVRAATALAWGLPLASLLAAAVPTDHALARHPLVRGLIARARFAEVPADDVERLGRWCRHHTPPTSRFVGPPGPKTFRLWSRRSLAFNRAASPYHADGLADWFARFQDHVDFHGIPADFAHAYVSDRHGFEARYQSQSDSERAALALRQGATYVVAAAPSMRPQDSRFRPSAGPLELLHVEGRYAVYRVKPELVVQRQR
ncbi:MAG TPA: DUF6798 domain-containing protein, partial [Isosphaeraceae bacterium]|nr:DUF6798 domain-containing protein [Isosphaeraceae bacterium]